MQPQTRTEHPDRVERGGDVVIAFGAVQGVEEEREARAVAVRRDLHPPPVAARRAPLDAAPYVIGVERSLAVLLAPVVPRVDFDPLVSGETRCRHLLYEPRQIAHIGDRCVHRIGRGGDVLGVLVLHSMACSCAGPPIATPKTDLGRGVRCSGSASRERGG